MERKKARKQGIRKGDVSLIIDAGNLSLVKHVRMAVLFSGVQKKNGKLIETDQHTGVLGNLQKAGLESLGKSDWLLFTGRAVSG